MNNLPVGQSVPQRKEPQVTSEVSRFQSLVERTNKSVTELENRLESVLRAIPSNASTGNGEKEYKVGLASALASENDNLGYIAAKIESILDRLEL